MILRKKITAEGAEIIDASGCSSCRAVDAHSHIGGFDTKTGAGSQRKRQSGYGAAERLRRRGSVIAAVCLSVGNRHHRQRDRAGQRQCDLRSGLRDQIRRSSLAERCVRQPFALKAAVGQSEGRLRQTQSKSDDAHGDRGNDPRILPSGSGLPPEEAGSRGRSGQNAEIRSGAGKRRAGAR